jgi:hypothetical protein
MTDKKELILRLPDDVFEIIKTFKEQSGVSYTNFIYNAIIWYCVSKGLITLKDVKVIDKNVNNR